MKTTYRKSCAPNLLVGSDLTLDPSFKVECILIMAPNLLVGSNLPLGPSFRVEYGLFTLTMAGISLL